MRGLAAVAVPLLGLTALLVVVTGGAEAWRYSLLLESRFDAVPAGPLHTSDALVVTGGVVSLLSSVLAGAVTLGWLVHASTTAAQAAAVTRARPSWQLVAGVLVPGLATRLQRPFPVKQPDQRAFGSSVCIIMLGEGSVSGPNAAERSPSWIAGSRVVGGVVGGAAAGRNHAAVEPARWGAGPR